MSIWKLCCFGLVEQTWTLNLLADLMVEIQSLGSAEDMEMKTKYIGYYYRLRKFKYSHDQL